MTNYGSDKILDCNTSFKRSLSKLSENSKIFDIGSSVYPMSTILWFSESLEKHLSNGVIKILIWAIKIFANLAIPWIINSPWSKAEKWQIRAPKKIWIATHHFKGLFLSFQKILKFLTLDLPYIQCQQFYDFLKA